MSELVKIENLLNIISSKIDAHNKFKKEYDKQLAFDFSLFNFFLIGENKISQILAYFLDEKQNHGQGNLFLNEFVKLVYDKEVDTTSTINICEKTISNKRRIDIYIELKDIIIAIENKIWADDQHNQLIDYITYLEQKSKGNFLLLYLNPYGLEPADKSISKKDKHDLIEKENFKIISYKHDIINLINKWISVCEADNVSHFLKEFKKFLETKFLGKNTLNMSKELRTIIYNNEREVQQLVDEYKAIENEVISKLNTVGKELDKIHPEKDLGIEIKKSGLFNWYGARVYKFSVARNHNKIWIQFVKEGIHLYSNYYLEGGTDERFKDILLSLNVNCNIVIDHKKSISELIIIFLEQIKIAIESFRVYDINMTIEKD